LGENFLLVLADVKKKEDSECFHYTDAIYFSEFKAKSFNKLIRDGKIIWEFRLHLNSPTNIRDHGSGFRISRKYIRKLYKKRIILLSSK